MYIAIKRFVPPSSQSFTIVHAASGSVGAGLDVTKEDDRVEELSVAEDVDDEEDAVNIVLGCVTFLLGGLKALFSTLRNMLLPVACGKSSVEDLMVLEDVEVEEERVEGCPVKASPFSLSWETVMQPTEDGAGCILSSQWSKIC